MVQPKLKSVDMAQALGDHIRALMVSANKPSAETLATLEREAQKLVFMQEVSAYAYQCLGWLASVAGDAGKVRHYFKLAHKKSNDVAIPMYFAQALKNVGCLSEALSQLDFYLGRSVGSVFVLSGVFQLYMMLGQSTKGALIMEQLKKLVNQDLKNFERDEYFVQLFKNTGIPEEVRLAYFEKAYQFAIEHGVNVRRPRIEPDVEDNHSLTYVFQDDDLSDDALFEMTNNLNDALIPFMRESRPYPLVNIIFSVEHSYDRTA